MIPCPGPISLQNRAQAGGVLQPGQTRAPAHPHRRWFPQERTESTNASFLPRKLPASFRVGIGGKLIRSPHPMGKEWFVRLSPNSAALLRTAWQSANRSELRLSEPGPLGHEIRIHQQVGSPRHGHQGLNTSQSRQKCSRLHRTGMNQVWLHRQDAPKVHQ